MSPIRERFIKVIEAFQYDIQKEIYNKKTFDILKDVAQKYFDIYGDSDLSDEDKEILHNILGDNFKVFETKNFNLWKDEVKMKFSNENIKIDSIIELLKKCSTDDGTFSGSLYDLYVLIGIAKGVNDINQGKGISLQELRTEREALYERNNRKFG